MTAENVPRWTAERAWRWYDARPWPLGFNYLPRTAVNFVEMWQAPTFDPVTIDEELGWAQRIGFNSLRTNPPFIVWQEDRAGLLERIDRFLAIAAARGLSVVLCPLDDCGFGGEEPRLGPQPGPVPGVHNSRAVASPGRATVMDRSCWPLVLDYVGDIVAAHRDDARVLLFDLYNEPGNRMIFTGSGERLFADALEPCSLDLMWAAFARARAAEPEQPLTAGAWNVPPPWETGDGPLYDGPIDRAALSLSDVTSFHVYGDTARFEQAIDELRPQGRPLLCTEWMARHAGSTIAEQLPILHRHKIGCYKWGLVRGRTQTHLPWPGLMARIADYDEATSPWFHDLLEPDGRPHDPDEIRIIADLAP